MTSSVFTWYTLCMTRLYLYDVQEAEKETIGRLLGHLEPVLTEHPLTEETVPTDAEILSVFV